VNRFPRGAAEFSLVSSEQIGTGANPDSYSMGNGFRSLGIKRPGREVDHSIRNSV